MTKYTNTEHTETNGQSVTTVVTKPRNRET